MLVAAAGLWLGSHKIGMLMRGKGDSPGTVTVASVAASRVSSRPVSWLRLGPPDLVRWEPVLITVVDNAVAIRSSPLPDGLIWRESSLYPGRWEIVGMPQQPGRFPVTALSARSSSWDWSPYTGGPVVLRVGAPDTADKTAAP